MRGSGVRHGGAVRRLTVGLVAALVATTAVSCTGTEAETPDAVPGVTAAAPFHAFGSVGQASVTGAQPGAELILADGEGNRVARGKADKAGSFAFYAVRPGDGYTVRHLQGDVVQGTEAFTVLDRDTVPPASLYSSQQLKPGLNYIRMRDGVELAMTLRLPTGVTSVDAGPFPTVIEYSGYEVAPPKDLLPSIIDRIKNPDAPPDPLVPSTSTAVGALVAPLVGFAVVSVQIRGSGCSGGAFDLFGLPTIYDGYDAVETVAAQPWVKGHKVGMVGISYSGYDQLFVAGTRPPHLAALAPMSVTDDLYDGIGFPGGIFNTGFAKNWLTERTKDARPAPGGGQKWATTLIEAGDTHCKDNQRLHSQAQDGLHILSKLEFKDPKLFADRTPGTWFKKVNVPVFLVGGLQDEQLGSHWAEMLPWLSGKPDVWVTMYNGNHDDALNPEVLTRWVEFLDLFVADTVPKVSSTVLQFAPLLFDQVAGVAAAPLQQSRLADLPDVETARAEFRKDPQFRIMLDVGGGSLGPGSLEPMWDHSFPRWPLDGTHAVRYFTADAGRLTTERPGASSTDTYRADPSARPETDQSNDRPKVFRDYPNDWRPVPDGSGLGFVTGVLDHDVVIAGSSSMDLAVTTDGHDTDLQATVTEVRPDGQETYVQTGWLRASHRKLDAKASTETDPVPTHLAGDAAMPPKGRSVVVRVPIPPVVHRFRAGSRIRVTVTAPGGDRPLWTFRTVDHGDTDVTVTSGGATPSALVLPVVDGLPAGNPLPACATLRGQPCRPYQPAANGG